MQVVNRKGRLGGPFYLGLCGIGFSLLVLAWAKFHSLKPVLLKANSQQRFQALQFRIAGKYAQAESDGFGCGRGITQVFICFE